LTSNGRLEKGLGADSEEKREPVSDIDTAVVDSLKVLDLKWPIREADKGGFWPAMACPLMTQQRHCKAELLHCR
jgi:hypothetical protein